MHGLVWSAKLADNTSMGESSDARPPAHPWDRIWYGWEYLLPMLTFLLLTWVGTQSPHLFPPSYIAKTFLAAGLLYWFWRRYTRIRWTHLGTGVLFGVIGVVQWVGMEKLLMSQEWLWWTRMITDIRAETFRPYMYFEQAPAWMLYGFLIVRWAGPTLVVPVMEELFWRDYLWRSFVAPNDFRMVDQGEYDHRAFWVIPLLFAAVHVQWLTAIFWGLLIAWLLVRTKSIGAVIVAHGVTNFLLGGWVLFAHHYLGQDDWFFW